MDLRPLLIAGLAAGIYLVVDFTSAPIMCFGPTNAFAKSGIAGGGGGHGGGGRPRATGTGDIGPSGHGSGSSASSEADSPFGYSSDGQSDSLPGVSADLQAFIHANSHTAVGHIAIYARALVRLESATSELRSADRTLAAARAALADANATKDRALRRLRSAYPDLDSMKLQETLNRLDNLIQDAGADDRTRAEIAAINNVIAAEAALATAQIALGNARATLADARAVSSAAGRAAGDALATAAGKISVDPAMKTYVDDALQRNGILDYYRSLVNTSSIR
jgi:hypothetical protein